MEENNEEKEYFYQRRRELQQRMVELYLWIIFGFLLSGRVFIDSILHGVSFVEVLNVRYFDIITGIIVVLFPFLFRLIFGLLPFEYIRLYRITTPEKSRIRKDTNSKSEEYSSGPPVLLGNETPTQLSSYDHLKLLATYAYSSRRIAESLYSRSGVYLLIGVLVAFSGLVFFYTQTASLVKAPETKDVFITLAPNFGILFFIEFIAFFFLRQYRSAMDEYRHYESIKRNREETLAALKLAKESGEELKILDLVKNSNFYSNPLKLNSGESTELIESKKLSKDEVAVFEKIIDVLGKK